jgi:hypothetical protein
LLAAGDIETISGLRPLDRAPRHPLSRIQHPASGILLFFLFTLAAPGASVPEASSNGIERIRGFIPVRSSTRPILAFGTNAVSRMDALRWAEDTTDKLESLVQCRFRFDRRELRILLREDPEKTEGWSDTTQTIEAGRLVQRLVIANYETTHLEPVLEQLCFLLLNGCVAARPNREAGQPWQPGDLEKCRPVPRWLASGLAQNLYPSLRARNKRHVLALWDRGLLPSAAAIIEVKAMSPGTQVAGDERSPADDSQVEGVFVDWLLSQDDRKRVLEQLFEILSSGESITTAALRSLLPVRAKGDTLQDGWEQWVLRQKRVIYAPGATPPEAVSQLRAELLLYPGLSGIPLGTNSTQILGLDYLIRERKAPWVPGVARAKIERLNLLALGRGPEFRETAAAYCRYLEAVLSSDNTEVLESCLEDARRKEDALVNLMRDAARSAQKTTETGEEKGAP